MRVFITGASGWIGSAVTDELLAHDHEVLGLARSDESAKAIEAKGAAAHRGDLEDPETLAAGAAAADAVIHLAMNHDFTDPVATARTERAAVQRMLTELEGSGKAFLLASGLITTAVGRPATEDDPAPDEARGGGENLALSYADRGVRPVALRFAASVHGMGDPGFVSVLAGIARQKGVAGYIGDGTNRWPAVHRADAAVMVRLTLEKAPAGARLHAVGEEGIPTREIAAAVGERLGLPTASVSPEGAEAHFGWMARFFGMDCAASSDRTRELLGWVPTGPSLAEDIAAGAYGE